MLSFIWRRDLIVSFSVLFFSAMAISYGVAICMISPSDKRAGDKVQLVQNYMHKAQVYPSSSEPLYFVSENMMLSAIALEPYISENWRLLSDVLFANGKARAAMHAKKISLLLDNKEVPKKIVDLQYSKLPHLLAMK